MNRVRAFTIWPFVSLLLAGQASALFGQVTNSLPVVSPSLPETSFSVLRVFGSLALVVGLFLGGVWCFRNWQRLMIGKGRNPRLQILEVKSLGGRHALYLVAYEQQRLLLGSSPNGINLITHLPDSDQVQPPAQAPTAFAQVLQRAVSTQS